MNKSILNICSWNVKGVQNPVKRKKILNYLKKEQIHIAFLQETHLTAHQIKETGWDKYMARHSPVKAGELSYL